MAFTKSPISFLRDLLLLLRPSSDVKLQNYPPPANFSGGRTLVFDLEGALLKSPTAFPYFMLVALEAGGLLRGILLLILYPLVKYCLSEGTGIKAMAMVALCGVRKDVLVRLGRVVMPKHLLGEVGLEGFEAVRKGGGGGGGRRVVVVGVSAMPREMVEVFLREYMEVDVVVGRGLRVFGGFCSGFLGEEMGVEQVVVGGVGFGGFSKLIRHRLFAQCKELYRVNQEEKRRWHTLPPSNYPKPLIFHDGRIAFLPSPLPSLSFLLYFPLSLPLALLRSLLFLLLPYPLATPLAAFTGLRARFTLPSTPLGPHHLYVSNHRTLLDPIYISTVLPSNRRGLTAVTYSVSRLSELLSPIPTIRLARNREEDRSRMAECLRRGSLAVCPEGTTCREAYLLRFSPLFAELAEEVVPVALDTRVEMLYGNTAGGLKWMDPFCFLMNPKPEYEMRFLERMGTRGMATSSEVANAVQREIGRALGFHCTALTRKDKYLILAGNEGCT